jgi:hypothetical protein
LTLTGDVVREGDRFDFSDGTQPFVEHKKALGAGADRAIFAAWASAIAPGRSPIVVVLDRDELLAVKNKSPGARKSDSPWNDPTIGFPAMCAKTAKRRLARHLPLVVDFQRAAAVDTTFEEIGRHSYLRQDGALLVEDHTDDSRTLDGKADPLDGLDDPGGYPIVIWSNKQWQARLCASLDEWGGMWRTLFARYEQSPAVLQQYLDHNRDQFARIGQPAVWVENMLDHLINGTPGQ